MSRPNTLKNYRQSGSDLKAGVKGTFNLARALPQFFRERITVQQAEEEIKRMLASREERFLELARSRIYHNPGSPYLKLLKIAGCEFADLQAHVSTHGLEATLERLAGEGVYLTADEFKGKKKVERGGKSFRVLTSDFEVQPSSPGFVSQSSGTNNQPLRYTYSLDLIRVLTFGQAVFLSAHDLFSYSHALYDAILPGIAAVSHLLYYARSGIIAERWFARTVPESRWPAASYHYINTYLVVLMGKLHDPVFPRPEFIGFQGIDRIVRWILQRRREGRLCCILTASSNAVRIARTAMDMGASLRGTKFIVVGEPFTAAKREVTERVEAAAIPRYAFQEGGTVGYGCANPVGIDDVHAATHMLGIIAHPKPIFGAGARIRPLLFTSLHSLFPRVFLNMANGDYANLEKRSCGCRLEKAGLTLHLHHIRSYEKFTSEGMSYFYGDLYEFFEKALPSEFGGGLGDYQLVEEEDDNGQTRLTLVVHPEVGAVDETKILLRLQERLSQGSSANRFQAKIWQDAGTLRVKRGVPHASARGKILPLHISR